MNPAHFALYILAINLLAWGSAWFDKQAAKRGGWRVPEANLLGLALLGGSPGLWLGMRQFRHKTAKRSFYWRVIAIILIQVAALIYALGTGMIKQVIA